MPSEYQLKIAYLYNIPLGNVNTLVPHFFGKKNTWFIMKLYNFTYD